MTTIKKDNRGVWSAKSKIANRAKILEFFAKSPEATYRQAAEALSLSPYTIMRHVKEAEAEGAK